VGQGHQGRRGPDREVTRTVPELRDVTDRSELRAALDGDIAVRPQSAHGDRRAGPGLLPDGTAIYDSGVIIEFLQELAASAALVPASGPARYAALTQATLADGITDAALLLVYEKRFRDPGTQSERWLDHQRGKIARALATFEAAPPDPAKTDIVAIALCCALAYLDWRRPVNWREDHPRLTAWLAAFAGHEPAFERTRAPNA